LKQRKVRDELTRVSIGPGPSALRLPEAIRDMKQELTMKLGRRAFLQLADAPLRVGSAAAARRPAQSRAWAGLSRASARHERPILVARVAECEQHVLRLDQHRLGRHIGCDRGVAVPVASDPAAETQKAGAVVVRGRCPWRRRTIASAIDLGTIRNSVSSKTEGHRPDLIQRLRLCGAKLTRPPQMSTSSSSRRIRPCAHPPTSSDRRSGRADRRRA